MNAKTLTAVALLIAALPAASFAQGAPARPTPPTLDFAAADTDGSGGISAEEWTAYSATLHSEMRAQRIAARADALIAAGDANGDTALDRDELIAAMTAQADERREARGERRGPMGGMMRGMMGGHHGEDGHGRGGWGRDGGRPEMRGDMHGPRGGERGGDRGPRAMGGDRAGHGFARIDANGDGQIDAEELAHAQEMINWMAQRPVRN